MAVGHQRSGGGRLEHWVAAQLVAVAISWTDPLTWLVAAVVATALLLSNPLAQFLLLRSAINHASTWIWVNAAAWLVGISWTFAVSPLVNESSSMVRVPLLSPWPVY